ncbi:MAG TPA: large conductance mechanosensitive channel protein MscL [Acidimicrobiales bacterium]
MSGLLKEFKEFISRGNVVDLAVAVVIGAAFTAVVSAVVEGLITPLVGMIGGRDFRDMTFTINDSTFQYGIVINAVIFFLSVAAVVFFAVVKPLNALQQRRRRGQEPVDEVQLSDEAALLTEIRDLLAVQGRAGAGRANPTTPPPSGGVPPAGRA